MIVDVRVDYSKKTAYTRGVIRTNLARFPLNARLRLISRAVRRRIPFPGQGLRPLFKKIAFDTRGRPC